MGKILKLFLTCLLILLASSSMNFRRILEADEDEGEKYSATVNEEVVFSELDEDKSVSFFWKKIKVPEGAKIGKIVFGISTEKSKLGKFSVVVGTTTTASPNFWAESSKIEKTFTTKEDKIEWTVDSKTAGVIQSKSGQLSLVFSAAECDSFTITTITAYIFDESAGQKISYKPNEEVVFSELDEDDKSVNYFWKNLKVTIPEGSVISKIVISLSTEKDKLGKISLKIGTTTTTSPNFWAESAALSKSSTSKADKIEWTIEEKVAAAIQIKTGQLSIVFSEVECDSFIITSIDVYFKEKSSSNPKKEEEDKEEEDTKDEEKTKDESKSTEDAGDDSVTSSKWTVKKEPTKDRCTIGKFLSPPAYSFSSYVVKDLKNGEIRIPWADLEIPSGYELGRVSFCLRDDDKPMGKISYYFGTSTSKGDVKTETYRKDVTIEHQPFFNWKIETETFSAIDFKKDELIFGIKSAEAKSILLAFIMLYDCKK